MELKIIDNKGHDSGVVQLDDALINVKGSSKAVLHEVVVAYGASQRSGTHGVKTRGEVSGGGVKPWKQKHTGRARSGSTRSPLWRKGGIIFGPVPRDYRIDLPKKKQQLAFRMAVKNAIDENRLQVVEPITVTEVKTKNVATVYSKWHAPTDSILLVDKIEPNFARASRNIANVRVSDVGSFNTYECLRARRIFITKPAFEQLTARMNKTETN